MTTLSPILQNVLPLVIVALVVWVVVHARQQPLWAEAYRRLARNPLALIALGVICLYGLIAVLDSLQWRDTTTEEPKTVLDRLFAHVPQERTHSAPLATMTTGEPQLHALQGWHLLGTDGNGKDVLYQALKGCRTAMIIGGFTSLLVTPMALLFGLSAGYFGKRVDDAVQYTYTVLASIPDILLLIALLLVFGHGLDKLCYALGITNWVGLCRLVRGETLKHREREYVRAAKALGVSPLRILARHILPNLLPLVIISITLGFSGLVLAESILSYLGIGVEAGTGSWGNMIDAARLELAREPVVWWNLAAASTALFLIVLAFNLFGDALRDALDPRLRST
jgi:peptide/nickel transport system permease protein